MIISKRQLMLAAQKYGNIDKIPFKCPECKETQTLQDVLEDKFFIYDIEDLIDEFGILRFEKFMNMCFNCGYIEKVPAKTGLHIEQADNSLMGSLMFNFSEGE